MEKNTLSPNKSITIPDRKMLDFHYDSEKLLSNKLDHSFYLLWCFALVNDDDDKEN